MNNDKAQPRLQISENKTRPRPSPRKTKEGPPFSKLLCCMCCNEDEPERECQDKNLGEVLAEMRRAQRDAERQDPSSDTSPLRETQETQVIQGQRNKICFHKKMKMSGAASAHNGRSEVPSSQIACKKSSDLEFEDARDYFSPSETENELEIIPSAKAPTVEVTANHRSISPMKHMKGILKRCRCVTCTGSMREIGNREPFRNSDVCDQRRWDQEAVIKLDPQLRVLEYNILSGEVQDERVEEVNLTGEHEPIRAMRNPDVVQDAIIGRTLTKGRLRNLFNAGRYDEVDSDQEDETYEADGEDEAVAGNAADHDLYDDQDWSMETLPAINENPQ